jgi:peptide/nickel transport system substrate-binding protein
MKKFTKVQSALMIIIIAIAIAGSVTYLWMQQSTPTPEEKILIIGSTEPYTNPDIDIGYGGLDQLFEPLRFDGLAQSSLTKPAVYFPQVAESWELKNATGAPYLEFKIRKGLKFQDGVPITAQVVKWSFERQDKVETGYAWWHTSSYSSLVAVDDYTLRVYLPTGYFLPSVFTCLFLGQLCTIKSPGAGENATGMEVVANGPFKLVEYVPGERLVLTKWNEYPDLGPETVKHQAYADKVIIRLFADPVSMRMSLEKGEIDIAWRYLTKQDLVALKENPEIVVETAASGYSRYLTMNSKIAPFNDTRVKQAVAYAINVKEILDKTQFGLSELSTSPLQKWMPYYIPCFDDAYNMSYSNVEKAKELLAEAGYPDGFTTELWITDHFDVAAAESAVATVIVSQLAKVGINVIVKQVEYGLFKSTAVACAIPMGLEGWGYDYADPDTQLAYCMAYSNGTGRGYQWWGYKNLTADFLLGEGRRLYDPTIPAEQNTERKAIYEQLQRIFTRDVVKIPLWQDIDFAVYRKNVKGYHVCWVTVLRPVWNAYKEEWGITPKWDSFEVSSLSASFTPFRTLVYIASSSVPFIPNRKQRVINEKPCMHHSSSCGAHESHFFRYIFRVNQSEALNIYCY